MSPGRRNSVLPHRRMLHSSMVSSTVTSTASSLVSSRMPSRTPSPSPPPSRDPERTRTRPIFRFFDLPTELRLRIYEMLLIGDKPLDLDPTNPRLIAPLLSLLLVSRRMHAETHPIFYSQPLRLFPTHGRFFHTARPLLSRLPPHYRACVRTVELRLGPGWNAPPRCQHTRPSLGLGDCTSLSTLRIFIELEPSDPYFIAFCGTGNTENTYRHFSVSLLRGILDQVPSLRQVELDAYPGVRRDSPMVRALAWTVWEAGKTVVWGPMRGWGNPGEGKGWELGMLEEAMAGMSVGGGLAAEGEMEVVGVAVAPMVMGLQA